MPPWFAWEHSVSPGEPAAIAEIVRMVHDAYVDQYKGGAHVYRMAHAKAHSCLNALFEVNSDVPLEFRTGIFAGEGRDYDAWIRSSNGTPEIEGDRALASRRFAIKELGVSGTKLLDEEPESQDFLRKRLKRRLAQGDACFDFEVQRFVSDETTPVEDGTAVWPEDRAKGGSPFVKVARIVIPKQNFDTPERDQFCDNLSFTPWHSLAEHRPLGSLNRMRREVYLESSRYRHQWNGTASPVK